MLSERQEGDSETNWLAVEGAQAMGVGGVNYGQSFVFSGWVTQDCLTACQQWEKAEIKSWFLCWFICFLLEKLAGWLCHFLI